MAGDAVRIKDSISDVIAKLESEASADATKKAYCDKELKESSVKKDDKASMRRIGSMSTAACS